MPSHLRISSLAASTCLVLWCLAPSLSARLGESEAQSQARYGAPGADLVGAQEQRLLPGAKELGYSFQGWRIRVAFLNGAAARLEYVKIPEGGALKALTDEEGQSILEAEKGAFRWREEKPRTGYAGLDALKTAFDGRLWERSDHAAAKLKGGVVIVVDAREVDAYEKKQAKGGGKTAPATSAGVPKF